MSIAGNNLGDLVHQAASADISGEGAETGYESHPLLAKLKTLGTELWLDTGDLGLALSIWKTDLSALTTNNTLANQVVQSGAMDDVIKVTAAKLDAAAPDLSEDELVTEIGFMNY